MCYKVLPYNQSLALLTDFYELTMAYGYWKSGVSDKEAVFHLFFRNNPFKSGFTIACGLEYVIDFLENFRLDKSDLDYLRSLRGNDERPIFDNAFLDYMADMNFSCDIDAVAEGTAVFPLEPLVRVQGPIIQCQILETALLNIINFQTLIATKARRMCIAAQGEPILEFGLRRAQGIDGSLAASRAAYIGGCSATSNVLAGKVFGIPVKGTHAHSWIMSFDDELESFKAYAKAMPNNCVFLVDTYDTLEGVRNAVEAGKWLRQNGHEMAGIRLDSGDLAYLSIEARKILDQQGFKNAKIIASNDLDENIITSLKAQGAQVNIWGVGTKLITAYDQPALGGVYKIAAVKEPEGEWKYKIKLSEQAVKVSNPGIQQVRRYIKNNEAVADVIYDKDTNLDKGCIMIDPLDMTRQKRITTDMKGEDLLLPVFRKGKRVYPRVSLEEIRKKAKKSLEQFHGGIKRFTNPHQYPVGLEKSLYALKTELILKSREVLM
ncbi:MAG: nicotinate phosphoribosyltransferase [Candidatus Omnitrophica bacterium]|nr:nicotinate phosphoribosyltransferase [Candidatus Omnitrophota bacterium]MBU4479395.1 nicotinate phosphoribosyltransferase [Candidatus Omnitrophota bacterium]